MHRYSREQNSAVNVDILWAESPFVRNVARKTNLAQNSVASVALSYRYGLHLLLWEESIVTFAIFLTHGNVFLMQADYW